MKKIRITINGLEFIAEINEKLNPKTALAVWNALPFESEVERWGDEIYFTIPVKLEEENSKVVVERGDIAYWPPGRAFCIFFGKTPASKKDEIRAASPVNVFGKILGDIEKLKSVKEGSKIRVEKV